MRALPDSLGVRLPIVAAPMAGGPTTVALAASVAAAGGLPFLAAGYKTPDAVADEIRRLEAVGSPFGVNVFVPSGPDADGAAFRAYAAELQPEADAHGVPLNPVPVADDDFWHEKLDMLTRHPVPVVSFTFGLPRAAEIAALRRAGSVVLASVTTPSEAVAAREAGADGLVVQGPDAGGHSATFDAERALDEIGTAELVGRVRAAIDLPVIAAGGVDGPAAVATLLAAGAEAVAVGTLLLRTDEAGTSATHRAALADPRFDRTVITHAFTGRPARGLHNGFIARHEATAPFGYPAIHHLTRDLRRAAAQAGDPDRVHLWAGTGYRSAPTGPAGDVIRWLATDLDR
ncbi:2-nitropropane dioxygenase [Microbacterium mangrovi]|uniref:Propionate 3-nitronate monooxygenase n=1 Tax=Microbacterium mangrovi TaxID=1348253 RepID=A0A0B2A9W1_9MICO|nr:nitronate monooxygenase [Microbacterium mangrovi]KHK99959.1 2-nitropropane dioxygenase [Microbacterium mangrovi]